MTIHSTLYVIFEETTKQFIKFNYVGITNLTSTLDEAKIYKGLSEVTEDVDKLNIHAKAVTKMFVINWQEKFNVNVRKFKFIVKPVTITFISP